MNFNGKSQMQNELTTRLTKTNFETTYFIINQITIFV